MLTVLTQGASVERSPSPTIVREFAYVSQCYVNFYNDMPDVHKSLLRDVMCMHEVL